MWTSVMNVQMRVRFHNSSPRSHASEDENRTRNGSKNFKCQRAFSKTIVPSCHNPVMEIFHSLFIVLKISMPFSYSVALPYLWFYAYWITLSASASRYCIRSVVVKARLHLQVLVFLLLMDVNEWMSYECSEEGTCAQNSYNHRYLIYTR
jgi:hypothetical protein